MGALHPGEVVVIRIDRILATVVGIATPRAVTVGIVANLQEVLTTIGNIAETHFVLPVNPADHGGLGWIVIFAPVIAAGVKMVEFGRAESPVPTEANHVAEAFQVVVVGVVAGKGGRSVGAGYLALAVVAIIAG